MENWVINKDAERILGIINSNFNKTEEMEFGINIFMSIIN